MELSDGGLFPPSGSLAPGSGIPQAHGCERCNQPLVSVTDCDAVHWLCTSCGQCWQVRDGHLVAASPFGCTGCAEQEKGVCIELLRARTPVFGPDPEL